MRAVLFDLDGTLVPMTVGPNAYIRAVREVSGRTCTREDVVRAFALGPTDVVLGSLIRRPATTADVACFFRHFEAGLDSLEPYPGIVEMLTQVAASGFLLGVFTGATARAANLVLRHTELLSLFHAVVGGDEVERPKPRRSP